MRVAVFVEGHLFYPEGGSIRKDTQGMSEQALTGWFLRQFQGHEK